jgi:hypothetical protein
LPTLPNFEKISLEYVFEPDTEPFPHLIETRVTFYPDPDAPNLNDTLVTVKSAHGILGSQLTFSGNNGKNHGTVIGPDAQNESIPLGQSALGWGELK